MTKNILRKEIIEIFKEKLDWEEQTIRDQVSRFKIKECPNSTQNAAAHILGLIKGVKVWNKLIKEDRDSLKGINIGEILEKYKTKKVNSETFQKRGASKKNIKEKNVTPLKYSKEATQMAEAYRWIFCLENSIRDFLREIFKKEENWIEKRLNDDIKKDIQSAKKEPYYAHKRTKDDLEYTTLGHLLHIILDKRNWKDILPYLKEKDKRTFEILFNRVLPSRNSTNHCIALPNEDIQRIEYRVKELAAMFNFK